MYTPNLTCRSGSSLVLAPAMGIDPMNDETEDLRNRLKELEEENRKLREGQQPGRSSAISTRIAMYKGHPVISFEGPFRPFSLGVRKASAIMEKIDDLMAFVEKYGRGPGAGQVVE